MTTTPADWMQMIDHLADAGWAPIDTYEGRRDTEATLAYYEDRGFDAFRIDTRTPQLRIELLKADENEGHLLLVTDRHGVIATEARVTGAPAEAYRLLAALTA